MKFLDKLIIRFIKTALLISAPCAHASNLAVDTLPTGGKVVAGDVKTAQSGNNLVIDQTSPTAIMNWDSFSIGSASTVTINQPDSNSVHLDRVTGTLPSEIMGKLNSNGQVYLINPNGIVFGSNGSVNASSFTASTLGITDGDFLHKRYHFRDQGTNAEIRVEKGAQITSTDQGGYVILLARSISHAGAINTNNGDVVMAFGDAVRYSLPLSRRVSLEMEPAQVQAKIEMATDGVIKTQGGHVLMRLDTVLDSVSYGAIKVAGIIETAGGDVRLGDGREYVSISGKLDAASGNIRLNGRAHPSGQEGRNAAVELLHAELIANGIYINGDSSDMLLALDGVAIIGSTLTASEGGIHVTGNSAKKPWHSGVYVGYSQLKSRNGDIEINGRTHGSESNGITITHSTIDASGRGSIQLNGYVGLDALENAAGIVVDGSKISTHGLGTIVLSAYDESSNQHSAGVVMTGSELHENEEDEIKPPSKEDESKPANDATTDQLASVSHSTVSPVSSEIGQVNHVKVESVSRVNLLVHAQSDLFELASVGQENDVVECSQASETDRREVPEVCQNVDDI